MVTALITAAPLSVVTACSSTEPGPASGSVSSAETSAAPQKTVLPEGGETQGSRPEISGDTAAGDDVVSSPPSKSWQDAVDAAREDFDGTVNKVELGLQEGGGLEYEVEQLSATIERAMEHDANTLAKLDEATETTRGEVDGVITKWKVEGKDSGKVIYELDIRPQEVARGQEVQVDAKDGSIVKDS